MCSLSRARVQLVFMHTVRSSRALFGAHAHSSAVRRQIDEVASMWLCSAFEIASRARSSTNRIALTCEALPHHPHADARNARVLPERECTREGEAG